MTTSLRRNRKTRKTVPMAELGNCSVYVMYSRGFNGTLRPAHDTSPTMRGWLTEKQVRELRQLVEGRMLRWMRQNGGGE